MTVAPGYPASTNVYIPNHEASGNMVIGYSRNPKKFNLPKYCKYIQAKQPTGYYMKISSQEQVRVVTSQEYAWPRGQPRPEHTDGLEQFAFVPFMTKRYDYGFAIDDDSAKLATWPIVQQHSRIHCTKLMTARTSRVLTAATTTTNWTVAGTATTEFDLSADHTNTATGLVGGQLDLGTTSSPYIKEFMNKVAVLIDLETAGSVDARELYFIINPHQAALWGVSPEIRDYIKSSPAAKEEVTRGLGPNSRFGLPSQLYGYNLIVENATIITSRKGATLTKAYAMPDQKVLVVSRPGGLVGVEGAPDFSTIHMFWYRDEMTLETFNDSRNRRVLGNVVEDTAEVVASPLSGYLLTASTSVAS